MGFNRDFSALYRDNTLVFDGKEDGKEVNSDHLLQSKTMII